MTDSTPEDTAAAPAAVSVRVPNVSAHAVSGLDHTPLNPPAEAPAEAPADEDTGEAPAGPEAPASEPEDTLPDIPEDLSTVPDLLAWVAGEEADPQSDEEADALNAAVLARARAVYAAETVKPEDDQRTTLVDPLRDLIASSYEEDADPGAGDAPDGA